MFAPDGQGLRLKVLGYQFPADSTSDYDSNWLVIQVEVAHPSGSWTASGAALLTYEASELAEWLDKCAVGREADEISFIEPCLHCSFRLEAEVSWLRVYFDLELRPRWAPVVGAGGDDLFVDLSVTPAGLRTAAADLREQLRQFPQRAAL